MKIVSLNIWNGGRLFEAAQDFLLEQQADLYFIQEAYDGHGDIETRLKTVELLTRAFPRYASDFAPTYLDSRAKEGLIEEGQLLLSRWPLIHQKNHFLGVPYGTYDQEHLTATGGPAEFSRFPTTIQGAQIEYEGKPVTVLNVHGPVNHNGTEDDPRRLLMRDIILRETTTNTIVAGDFNVQPATQTIQGLNLKLKPVFDNHPQTSFNLQRKDLVKYPGYATAVVDMCFVTPDFQVKTATRPEVDISDHLPMVIELEL